MNHDQAYNRIKHLVVEGTKFRVTRKVDSNVNGWTNCWTAAMDDGIGHIGECERSHNESHCGIRLRFTEPASMVNTNFRWPVFGLEPVLPPPPPPKKRSTLAEAMAKLCAN